MSADLETIQDRSCVAPVLQVFQFEECVLAVTPSKCSFVKFDADGSCDVQQSQWRDLLSVSASHRGSKKRVPFSEFGRFRVEKSHMHTDAYYYYYYYMYICIYQLSL